MQTAGGDFFCLADRNATAICLVVYNRGSEVKNLSSHIRKEPHFRATTLSVTPPRAFQPRFFLALLLISSFLFFLHVLASARLSSQDECEFIEHNQCDTWREIKLMSREAFNLDALDTDPTFREAVFAQFRARLNKMVRALPRRSRRQRFNLFPRKMES